MSMSHRAELQKIRSFPQLIRFLRDEMGWPIESEEYDDLVFDYEAEELGLDAASAAKIKEIKRLRPLAANQPWGIFFVSFEPKRLPVVALRRILSAFVMRKRESANAAERMAWETDDLLFISNYGEGEERQLSFAHFSQDEHGGLPTLRVLGWDNLDTPLHLDHVADQLTEKLAWPRSESDVEQWRETWGSAFTLRHGEVIATSKALAVRLAVLARAIRDRVRTVLAIETDSGPVTQLMKGFKEALVHDLEADDFADMYAQTVAYGLLSARIANPKAKTAEGFAGQLPISSPFLKELMETFLHVGDRSGGGAAASRLDFDELGVSEVVELLDGPKTNMEAVVRDFGDKNPQEDPVIHFYEDFLREYDKKQKVKRGVFYTPRPVVSYIVRSVDELLRSEFGLADGLADITTWGEMIERHEGLTIPKGVESTAPFVTILDLATGTGTFLVETIDVVHRTLVEKWKREGNSESEILDLWNDYVPKHLLLRLYGYELLMAPYAIAHLKIGLKLHETGYRFRPDDRLRVYLTNSLEPASDIGQQALTGMLPALAHEAHAVNEVKRNQRFTVVIGNPPYSGLSANMAPWIDGLLRGQLPDGTPTASYYHVDGEPLGERKLWLQDDYVKFIRLSQWLLDTTGCGVHGYITNHGYLDNPTFRGMRWSLMRSFSSVHVLDLHGNAKKQETTPDGGKDSNVFDIQQGVAIGLFVKNQRDSAGAGLCPVLHSDMWGDRQSKYYRLLSETAESTNWRAVEAAVPFYLFEPFDRGEAGDYYRWRAITEIMPINVTGVVTARDGFVIDFDRGPLVERMRIFLDERLSDEQVRLSLGLKENYAWRVATARDELSAVCKTQDLDDLIAPILYRPFDERLIFWHPSVVWRPRTQAMPHMLAGENVALITCRQQARTDQEWTQVGLSRTVLESCAISNVTREINYAFPLYLYQGVGKADLELFSESAAGTKGRRPNLAPDFVRAIEQTTALGFASDGEGTEETGFVPEDVLAYVLAVFHSPEYRRRFAPMLKLDFPRIPLPGSKDLFNDLSQIGSDLIALHLMESPNLAGLPNTYVGPDNPEVGRVGWSDDAVWIDCAPTKKVQPGSACFRNVPEAVWDFRIGCYRVCEKWLKDRRGRTLSDDDIAHYQKIVVALSETIRIMGEIDEVIEKHGGWPGAFSMGAGDEA